MGLELEAKVKVDSHDDIRGTLERLSAERLGGVFEINHILDNAERTLLAENRGLRVRAYSQQGEAVPPATITYKGPPAESKLKMREELESAIEDPAAMLAILMSLGFKEFVSFEKRRETWRLGHCHVELDELPHLGEYVEIEGPNEEAIHQTLEQLGLTDRSLIRRSYISLLVEYCERHRLPKTPIAFSA
jgi:adenylate cyclase class 2